MIPISELTQNDVSYLINVFGIELIRKLFQKNPHEFQRMAPGRVAKALSVQKIHDIVWKNISTDFIFNFINHNTQILLDNISKDINSYTELYEDSVKSFIEVIEKSPFKEKPELYFKLTEKPCSEEYLSLLKYLINSSETNFISNDNSEKESIEELKKEFEQKEQNYKSEIQELIQLKKFSDKNYEKVKTELIEKNIKLNESNETVLKLQELLEETKKTEEILEEDDEYEHLSICKVYVDYNRELCLSRLADISEGRIIPFECNEYEPKLFNNRTKLFYKDGPSDKGFFGLWKWNAIPNNNDQNKDYVKTQYYSNYAPIEVIVLDNIEDIGGLVDVLKSGINVIMSSYKTIFCIKTSETSYSGLLCTNKETEISGDIIRLKSDLYSLEKYEFNSNDIITLNGKLFYHSLKIKSSSSIVNLYDPIKIVKDIVLKRASWAVLKQRKISRNDWKNYRDFISELPNKGVYEEICDACQCSQEEAEQYLSKLTISAEEYINNENIENAVLESVISNNSYIIDRCKEMLAHEWQVENADKLQVANEKLKKITDETNAKRTELQQMQMEKQKAEDKLEQIISDISQKEQLIVDVEEKVAAKINDAKKNAADFISEMAFISSATSEKVCEC